MKYYLSLGSNLGDRKSNLARAVSALKRKKVRTLAKSSLYETQPVDVLDQPWFFNQVIEVETELTPFALLSLVKAIEMMLGPRPAAEKGPRRIDIDILLAEGTILSTELLTIPHPRMQQRNFVLVPLAEIAPEVVHPVLKKTIRRILKSSPDQSVVRKLEEPTQGKKGDPRG